jgi:hypothetical protein
VSIVQGGSTPHSWSNAQRALLYRLAHEAQRRGLPDISVEVGRLFNGPAWAALTSKGKVLESYHCIEQTILVFGSNGHVICRASTLRAAIIERWWEGNRQVFDTWYRRLSLAH